MAICPSAVFNKESPYYDEVSLLAGQGFKVCEGPFEYIPRRPEESVLYKVMAENISQESGDRSQESAPPPAMPD